MNRVMNADLKERVVNLPNALTLLRLFAVPGVAWLIGEGAWSGAFGLFMAAAVTDGLDGWIARRFDMMTALGAALDTLADKALGLVTLVLLTRADAIPLWVTLAVLGRDSLIVAGALTYRGMIGPLEIHPTWLGKTHTAAEFVMLTLTLAVQAGLFRAEPFEVALFFVVFGLAVVSAAQYVWLWGAKARRDARRQR